MKRIAVLLLLAVCVGAGGCVKYRVTLNNGETFTVLGKPKYDEFNRVYRYKAGGEEQTVSEGRVIRIAPASDSESDRFPSSGY
jgi:hypothetical protein